MILKFLKNNLPRVKVLTTRGFIERFRLQTQFDVHDFLNVLKRKLTSVS